MLVELRKKPGNDGRLDEQLLRRLIQADEEFGGQQE